MDRRLTHAVVAVVATLPLLVGCGTGTATGGDGPTATPAPSISAALPETSSSGTTSSTAGASTPASTDAARTKQVQAATTRFVRTVLTIGYPDRTFGDYTARIEPLMTERGFASLESTDSIKQGSTAITTLYAQRARSAPRFTGAPAVTVSDATTATATVAYENVAEQRSGDGWKTLKSLGEGSTTVRLVLVDGAWLVDNAS